MKTTLKKVLAELQKENPDLSYIRGMIEVLLDDEDAPSPEAFHTTSSLPIKIEMKDNYLNTNTDEASILDAKAKAHIERFGMPKSE